MNAIPPKNPVTRPYPCLRTLDFPDLEVLVLEKLHSHGLRFNKSFKYSTIEDINKVIKDAGKTIDVVFKDPSTGEDRSFEAPVWWDALAVQMCALRYARDIPNAGYKETSVQDVCARLVRGWTDGSIKLNGVTAALRVNESLLYLTLLFQMWAPNSPQWFNTGLRKFREKVDHKISGYWGYDEDDNVVEITRKYDRSAPHACFIQSVDDNLSEEGGIMDLVASETKLFKMGSGTGSNFSSIRGKGMPLTGGGVSSGLMSFLKTLDANAGSIKSGGTTRRAAKMVIVDATHPDLDEFITWKEKEEFKVASLVAGSKSVQAALEKLRGDITKEERDQVIEEAVSKGVPYSYLEKELLAQLTGHSLHSEELTCDWRGTAYATVDGQNSNNSIRMTREWVLNEDSEIPIIDGSRDKVLGHRRSGDVLDKIAQASWACADPAVQFMDTINEAHTCPEDGAINASNPCSEYYFLDDTACNLASLNILAFTPEGSATIDEYAWRDMAVLATLVLDRSIDIAMLPTKRIAEGTLRYRTLGLGYANLGAYIMRNAQKYGSQESIRTTERITHSLHLAALAASDLMGRDLGAFPAFELNKKYIIDVTWEQVRHGGPARTNHWTERFKPKDRRTTYRNAQVTVIAPTGTIGLVMGCDTTGIEPDFALVKYKTLSGGGSVTIVNGSVLTALKKLEYSPEEQDKIQEHILKHGSVDTCEYLKDEHKDIFLCATHPSNGPVLSWKDHLKVVAAAQQHLSGGISKTVNLPQDATTEDIKEVIRFAAKKRIKAVSIYRDASKLSQPLSFAKDEKELPQKKEEHAADTPNQRRKLSSKRKGYTQSLQVGNHKVYLRTGEYEDGSLGEIFVNLSKAGSALSAILNAWAMAVSLALQHGASLELLAEKYIGTKFEPNGMVFNHDHIKFADSIIDAIFKDLALNYLDRKEYSVQEKYSQLDDGLDVPTPAQPKVNLDSVFLDDACPDCGEFKMIRSGTCTRCTKCGATTGCS